MPAAVAQVAGHGSGIYQLLAARHAYAFAREGLVGFVSPQALDGAVGSVAEQDELDAVESQQLLAHLVAGVADAFIAIVEHGYLVGIA